MKEVQFGNKKQLEKVLEQIDFNDSVKYGDFIITKVKGNYITDKKFRIEFQLPNRRFFIVNALDFEFMPYFEIEKITVNKKEGWLKHYGHGKHPLDEFNWEFDPHIKTIFEYLPEEKVYYFLGNHKDFAGAFRYFIWNEKLAKEIRKKLKEVRR